MTDKRLPAERRHSLRRVDDAHCVQHTPANRTEVRA